MKIKIKLGDIIWGIALILIIAFGVVGYIGQKVKEKELWGELTEMYKLQNRAAAHILDMKIRLGAVEGDLMSLKQIEDWLARQRSFDSYEGQKEAESEILATGERDNPTYKGGGRN